MTIKDNVTYEDFAKLDIRTGTVLSVEPVLKSKKLLKFEIDFGEEIGVRTILSGIAPIELDINLPGVSVSVGTKVMAVVNFAPRSMMGFQSYGMILSAKLSSGHFLLANVGGYSENGLEIG